MKTLKKNRLFLVLCLIVFFSCKNDVIEQSFIHESMPDTRSVMPDYFDWENADWMPTPTSQTPIPVPWVGQGSLSSLYGLDVLNDRKASEGWSLVYSTFTTNGNSSLINPYFILYNRYRGIMRIFLYTTTQFVAPSTYLQDGLTIVSNHSTSLLNFLGTDMVDATSNRSSYQQVQPAPPDGSMPLASNKWYMMQYELAYDPDMASLPYNEIQLSWNMNYYNIDSISLGGKLVGSVNGTVGTSSSSNNMFSSLMNGGKVIGTGALSVIGQKVITNSRRDSIGNNSLGLAKSVFNAIDKGIKSAISAASGNLPGAIVNIFNALIGGNSGTQTSVNLTMSADIKLTGSGKSSGSFPSMPISFWLPGTLFSSNVIGFVPLYNKPLGVINFKGKPDLVMKVTTDTYEEPDEPFDPDRMVTVVRRIAYIPKSFDYSAFLCINPEVSKVANVSIVKQDIIVDNGTFLINPDSFIREDGGPRGSYGPNFEDLRYGVRFTIKVKPLDGSPISYIYKTFELKGVWKEEN